MNKVKFGLCNVHIAPITSLTNSGITYDEIFEVPGAVNLTLDAQGDAADFYADNTKYFNVFANNGYSGSLELALITNEFREKILNEVKDANGAFFESTDDKIKSFALGFQIDGDQTNRKYWFFNVSASRPSTASKTIEATKEPQTETINITAASRIVDNKVRVFIEEDEDNKAAYDAFFDSVYEEVPSA